MEVIFSTQADEDIAEIFQYINDVLNNTTAAYNIVDKILDLTQKLSRFPELGSNLKTIDTTLDNYRYLIADNYLVVYRVVDQEVLILRIVYARSNYARLLQG